MDNAAVFTLRMLDSHRVNYIDMVHCVEISP